MNENKNIEIEIKELFKEFSTDVLYETWVDTFDVQYMDGKEVLVCYHGTDGIRLFKKQCYDILVTAIYSVLGSDKKVKIQNIRPEKKVDSKTQEKVEPKVESKPASKEYSSSIKKGIRSFKFFIIGMIFVCLATAVIVVMCNYIGNRNFRETFYSVSSIKVDGRVRVIQLSDMHNARYGQDNQRLLERIEALQPDIIICTGDMVNSAQSDVDYAVGLAEKLAKIAPSYYVYGNNEVETIYDIPLNEKELDEKFGFDQSNRDESALLNLEDLFEEKLESAGMHVLKNEKDTIEVNTTKIDVYGVLNSNPSSFWSYSEKAFLSYVYENAENLKITAVHEPFIFETFTPEYWGDLMVCGHTHGGIVRVPVLGPLYTKEGGIFPERSGHYTYGRYDVLGRPLIISSGLENSNVFRVNNQPELVVIDINKF